MQNIRRPSWNPIWRPAVENSDTVELFPDIENIGIDTWILVLGTIEQDIC